MGHRQRWAATVEVPAGNPVARGSRSLVVTVPGTTLRQVVSLTTRPAYLDSSSWRVINKRTPVAPDFGPAAPAAVAGVDIDQRARTPLSS